MIPFLSDGGTPPITRELFEVIRLSIPAGSTILELGSGEGSTLNLKNHYNLYSVEHQNGFIGRHNDAEKYIYAPIGNYEFYDPSYLTGKLPKYDALLVDGPDTEQRNFGFLQNINLFDRSVHWFFDDYDGRNLGAGFDAIVKHLNVEPIIFKYGLKHFSVILGEGK